MSPCAAAHTTPRDLLHLKVAGGLDSHCQHPNTYLWSARWTATCTWIQDTGHMQAVLTRDRQAPGMVKEACGCAACCPSAPRTPARSSALKLQTFKPLNAFAWTAFIHRMCRTGSCASSHWVAVHAQGSGWRAWVPLESRQMACRAPRCWTAAWQYAVPAALPGAPQRLA